MLCAGQSQDCPDPCFAHEQSQDCAANPWFVPQTMDPGFAQDNPGIAQIHALRVTYIPFPIPLFYYLWSPFLRIWYGRSHLRLVMQLWAVSSCAPRTSSRSSRSSACELVIAARASGSPLSPARDVWVSLFSSSLIFGEKFLVLVSYAVHERLD